MHYCKVINGEKVDGPRAFSGKTQQELLNEGWLPHRLVEISAPDSVFLGSTFEVTPTEVVETQQYRPMTEQEKLDRKNAEEAALTRLQTENNELKAQVLQLQTLVNTLTAT